MSPVVGLFILLGLGFLVFLLGFKLGKRTSEIRGKDYRLLREERNHGARALMQIETVCATYSDIDSPVVGQIRPILREHIEKRLGITP